MIAASLPALLLLVTMTAIARPTLEEVRKDMGTPSTGEVRGQRDTVGYAVTPQAMARVWELSTSGPAPESFGAKVAPGVLGVIGPHDDYVYTARVYREIFPLVTARTVVIVGVFHRYRKFEARDQLVFDSYRAWRSPDGEIAISPLRDELEASRLGVALAAAMRKRGWQLGRDVAIVISADGTHYGEDFKFTPYGAGGVQAFDKAVGDDRKLMRETLGGLISAEKARAFFTTVVDPANPDQYRRTWCGRFSVTLGTLLVAETARELGLGAPRTVPVALGVSVDTPEIAVRDVGLGPTAPANLYHFVTHPALAFVP